MTGKQLIEMVQQHHPTIGEKELLMIVNRAKDEFCERSEIARQTTDALTTTADAKWYDIPSAYGIFTKIEKVYLNNVEIGRMIGRPRIRDDV